MALTTNTDKHRTQTQTTTLSIAMMSSQIKILPACSNANMFQEKYRFIVGV
jgi:hypothetical protein